MYPSKVEIVLNEEDWSFILTTARPFLPRVISNEDQYQEWVKSLRDKEKG